MVKDWFGAFELLVDLGYKGLGNYYKSKGIQIPHKKNRKSKNNPEPKLSEKQKEENTEMARKRVVVENAIGGMKRYNFLAYPLRMKNSKLADDLISICAGLWNFKLTTS